MFDKKNMVALAIGAALVGLFTTAASNEGQGRYKLGGAWVGKGAGTVWQNIVTPLDPQGQTAALNVKFASLSPDLVGLGAAFGADSFSDFVGQAEMINRDTDVWTLVGYGQSHANGLQIRAIVVTFGTLKFTDNDHAVLTYTITVYPAEADADGDGMPDAGATPVVTIPNVIDTAQRVPIIN
jgi:hypothetical protein